MGFAVSRQRYYPSQVLVVEIAVGNKSNMGSDILKPRYLGEDKNFKSPIDAVNVAVRIFRQWNRDYADEIKRLCIVDKNFQGGRKFFEFTDNDIKSAMRWAENIIKHLIKCDGCSKSISSNKGPTIINELPTMQFCGQDCADQKYKSVSGKNVKSTLSKNKIGGTVNTFQGPNNIWNNQNVKSSVPKQAQPTLFPIPTTLPKNNP